MTKAATKKAETDAAPTPEAEPEEQAPPEVAAPSEPEADQAGAGGAEESAPLPQQAILWVGDLADAPRDGRRVVLIGHDGSERVAVWRRTRKHEGHAWVPHELWAEPFSNLPAAIEAVAWRPESP